MTSNWKEQAAYYGISAANHDPIQSVKLAEEKFISLSGRVMGVNELLNFDAYIQNLIAKIESKNIADSATKYRKLRE